jgi:hypothetical protein
MSPSLRNSLVAILLLFVFALQTSAVFACGPFALEPVFSFSVHPEYPLEKYAAGDVGVVQPSYARSYLYVAYRYLSGNNLNAAEQAAVVELWRARLDLGWEYPAEQAVKDWLEARQKIPGVGEAPKIDVYRNREKPNDYENYLNCQGDAFDTARATLTERAAKLGADSPALKEWLAGQDLVFANCGEGQHIPADLPATADNLLRADRKYQIAAANFYSGNFAAASQQFDELAADTKSPWRLTAPYLKARTLVREASLGPAERKQEALSEAERQLKKVLATPELKSSHAAATRLLNLTRLRLHPEERLHELALSLMNTDAANIKQNLWDYTVLLDQFVETDAHHTQASTANLHQEDLTDWIVTFQDDAPEAIEHALARWDATHSIPWLIAALAGIDAKHAKTSQLLQAAEKIPSTSPAFPLVAFHSIRLDIAAGRTASARVKLDGLLQTQRAHFNNSARNLLQHQRSLVATSVDDFLAHAQQVPAGFSWNEDGRELPADLSEVSEIESVQGKPLFDPAAGEILNQRLNVALLAEAANSKILPEHLRRDVAQATWLRAVLLGNHSVAKSVIPTLRTLVPELDPYLTEYEKAADPAAKKFAAIYAWLKFPGMEPVIDTGMMRGTPLNVQDSYRDNWWCSAAAMNIPVTGTPKTSLRKESPAFLTAAQISAADKEFAALSSLGTAPNYLSRQVIEWATAHPNDPRVPEALHLAVKSTRYGCTDKQTGRWSKAAYDFLHRRYPNNSWTKQTPYWFKD